MHTLSIVKFVKLRPRGGKKITNPIMFDVKHIKEDESNLLIMFNEFLEHVYH